MQLDSLDQDAPAALAAKLIGARGDHTLLLQFGEFFAELLRLKYTLTSGGRLLGPAGDGSSVDTVGIVHQRLRLLLENQAARTRQWGGAYGDALYREAQYVMAALADETMLTRVEWEGRAAWQDCLLEAALFGTRVAGEEVFARLDVLLADGRNAHPDLATIYLVALAVGFRGRCWRPENEAELATYRAALGRIVAHHDPESAKEGRHLFPQAHAYTAAPGRPVRLPYLRPWVLAFLAVLLVFGAVQEVVWSSGIAGLVTAVERISLSLAAGG